MIHFRTCDCPIARQNQEALLCVFCASDRGEKKRRGDRYTHTEHRAQTEGLTQSHIARYKKEVLKSSVSYIILKIESNCDLRIES